MATSVIVADELPEDLEMALAPLSLLDDAGLWRAARTTLPSDVAQELESLNLKRQREGLTEPEAQTTAALVRQYERTMLVRAQAAALFRQRGQDISSLLNIA